VCQGVPPSFTMPQCAHTAVTRSLSGTISSPRTVLAPVTRAGEHRKEHTKAVNNEARTVRRLGRSQVLPGTVVVVLLTTLLLVGILYFAWQLSQIIRWIVIALFLAVAIDPVVDWIQQRGVRRAFGILLVYLSLLLALVGVAALLLPPLVDQVQELVNFSATFFQRPGGPSQGLQDLATRYGLGNYVAAVKEQATSLPSRLGSVVVPLLSVTKSIVTSVTAFVSILLLTFFFVLDGKEFVEKGIRRVSPSQQPRLRGVLSESSHAVYGYLSGNLVISLIAGIASFLAMSALRLVSDEGMPFSLALALVVALLDLIPLVGATLGAAVVVLVALFVQPVFAAVLAVYFLIYQQIENNVLQPVVYGRSVHLHPLAIFVAVLVGAELLGILGALLAIPVAEIIRILSVAYVGHARDEAGAVDTPHLVEGAARATGQTPPAS